MDHVNKIPHGEIIINVCGEREREKERHESWQFFICDHHYCSYDPLKHHRILYDDIICCTTAVIWIMHLRTCLQVEFILNVRGDLGGDRL